MTETLSYKTAGGVVLDEDNRLLALARTVVRNGGPIEELRLPKGHIDPGETDAQAALREVGEESGYWDVAIEADLGTAHSSFYLEGIHYERDEHYFLMRLVSNTRKATQPVSEEEALFTPQWISIEEAPQRLTYPSEKEFARRASNLIRNKGIPSAYHAP